MTSNIGETMRCRSLNRWIVTLAAWLSMGTELVAQESIIGTLGPRPPERRVEAIYDDGGTHELAGPPSVNGEVAVIKNGSQVYGQSLEFGETSLGRMFEVEGGELFLKGGRTGAVFVNDGFVEIENTELFDFHYDRAGLPLGSFAAFGDSRVQIKDNAKIWAAEAAQNFPLSLTAFDNSRIEVQGGFVYPSVFKDNSVLQLSGGQMHAISLGGRSQFEMFGGQVSGEIHTGGESRVALHAGKISGFFESQTGFRGSGQGSLIVGDVETSVENYENVASLFDLSGESMAEVTAGNHYVRGVDASYVAKLTDSATLRFEGGNFRSLFVCERFSESFSLSPFIAEGSSNLVIADGEFEANITLAVPRGLEDMAFLALRNNSTVTLKGGSIQLKALRDPFYEDATVKFRAAIVSDQATLNILGGAMTYHSDGLEQPVTLEVRDEASLSVTGSDFNYPLGTITDLEGELTGVLADGNSFRWNFIRGENATIRLVPEPSTALLFALAATFTVSRTRRRRI